jgi:formylglycine-generating enzyme required for sulfatase activity
MKITTCRLMAFALLAILPACSKKPVDVSGQVFVVTQGRENIKMGGLEVRVIQNTEFQNTAKATVQWMQEEALTEAQRRADADFMTAFIKEIQAMEDASANPIPELTGIRRAIVEESGQANSILESALSGGMLKQCMGKLISGATSTLSISTDADGRFTVPITGKTWFLAAGQRQVGKETEEYIWVKGFEPPADVASATLVISNEADINSEDRLYSALSGAIGAPGELDRFRKAEASEKMKSLVARHREAVNAAKAKAEREASEAKAQLAAKISNGKVGAALGVPLSGKSAMPCVFCPAGSFTMGSPTSEVGRPSYESENQVRVTLTKGFWLAKTEVTQAQWQAVMGNHPSSFKGDNLPVENVSWNDAQEFISKVNGSGMIPDGWKMTLPTEAQWEYACRAGEAGPYSGGILDQVAWYNENSEYKTHEVGTKKPNAWGLHDMHGNVLEWCADWHDDVLQGGTDPEGPVSGVCPVFRGGSWWYGGSAARSAESCHALRAASRGGGRPSKQTYDLGFRPALVPSK